jgi:TolB-like protein
MPSFFDELKRRNVFRVGIAYAVAAWVLLQVVDLVLDNIAAPEWIMKVFMLAVAVGLPLALILAWAFEMTPEGLKPERDVDRSQSITPQTGRKLDRIIIGTLVLAVALLLADRYRHSETQSNVQQGISAESRQAAPSADKPVHEITDKSIAVLPLANRSARPEDAFFAEGLHDELLTQLSRVAALRVISRTSVMGYAGTSKRMPEIGKELGVSTLLEGGVQRSGNRVRINVQLIEADTDEHLWAEVYDRELTAENLFDIQSDITRAIARALQAVLSGQEQQSLEQKPTENLDAYAQYLRGKAAAATFGRDVPQIDAAIAAYKKAIELDPKFAAAYAALSTDLTERYWTIGRVGDQGPSLKALDKARELAPDAPETLIAEGYYHYWGHLEYEPAIEAFDRALEARPGDLLAMRGRAYTLRRMGRFDDSIDTFARILTLDPLNGATAAEMAYSLSTVGRFDEAKAKIQQAKALGVSTGFARYTESSLFVVEGRLEEARAAIGPLSESTSSYELSNMLAIARYSRDAGWVDQIIDFARQHELPDDDLRTAEQMRAQVLFDRGQKEQLDALLEQLEPALLKLLDTDRSQEGPIYFLISAYGQRGDRARLDEMAYRYDHDLRPDALRPVEQGWLVPLAYASLGDVNTAMDRIEPVMDKYGIWNFYIFALDPVFDPYRDNPRYKALDARYRQWLETRKK